MMIRRELEFDNIEKADRAMYNLGMLCCELARDGFGEDHLITVEQCIAYLDHDGDYVVRP